MLNSLTLAALLALVQHTQQCPDVKLVVVDESRLFSLYRGHTEELWETQSLWTLDRPSLGAAEPPGPPRLVLAAETPPSGSAAILLPPASTAGQPVLKVHVS